MSFNEYGMLYRDLGVVKLLYLLKQILQNF